jgi:phosphoglucosamine mutase
MFNLGAENYLKSRAVGIIRTPVGDRHITAAINDNRLGFGGEGSGHIIVPEIWKCGDGLLTALMVLQLINTVQLPLSELVREIKVYPTTHKVVMANKAQKAKIFKSKEFKKFLSGAEAASPDSRIIVRPSGTENLIRITVESQEAGKSEQLAEQLRRKILAMVL